MAAVRRLSGLLFPILLLLLPSCNKTESSGPPPLSNSYLGTLSFEFSRGFPEISVITQMSVSVEKNRTVTFGSGESKSFDQEDIHYDLNGKPVTKVRMAGTVSLIEAKGAWYNQNDQDFLLILIHSSVEGQMTVWGWDDNSGWIQMLNTPFSHEDTYDEGETQFSVDDAVLDGSSVSVTFPDVQGESVYSYTLNLVVGLK